MRYSNHEAWEFIYSRHVFRRPGEPKSSYFREFSARFSEPSRDTNAFPTILFDIVILESNKGRTRRQAKFEDAVFEWREERHILFENFAVILMANIRTIYWLQRLVFSYCAPISACSSAEHHSTRRSVGEKNSLPGIPVNCRVAD